MKDHKTILSLTLAFSMTMTAIGPIHAAPANSAVNYNATQDSHIQSGSATNTPEENTTKKPELKDGTYVPGEILIGLYPDEADAPDATDIEEAGLGAAASLMDEGTDLMDISDAAKEISSDITDNIFENIDTKNINSANSDTSNTDTENNNSANPDTGNGAHDNSTSDKEAVIRLIRSDRYTTKELMEMYSSYPGVIFAEPNYIYQLEESDYLPDEGTINSDLNYKETNINDLKYDISITNDLQEETASNNLQSEDTFTRDPQNENAITEALKCEETITKDITYEESLTGDASQKYPDLTSWQYTCQTGPGGIDVPGWNDKNNINAAGVVAVMDTGVDYLHPDLADVMWDEGEKYPALTKMGGGKYGFNAASKYNKLPTNDPGNFGNSGHGTHCAGIIAGIWNDQGISGVANGTQIMSVNVAATANGGINESSTILGFEYIAKAKKAGINIICVNCSFGGPADSLSHCYTSKEMEKLGIITAWASGNQTANTDIASFSSSIFYDLPGTVTVDSNDKTGNISGFSNYGIRSTDLFAPGTQILSTVPLTNNTLLTDPKISLPAKDISSNEIINDYSNHRTYFTMQTNEATGTLTEISDGLLKIKKAKPITDDPDPLTKETIGNDPSNGTILFTLKAPNPLPKIDNDKKYVLMVTGKSNTPKIYLKAFVKTIDGNWERPNYTYPLVNDFTTNLYPIDTGLNGGKFDLDDLQIIISVSTANSTTTLVDEIDISSIWITDSEGCPFAYLNGTSMAAPAVSGMTAVLAKSFPDDSAAKRTARILAGVSANEAMKYRCVTGGMANMRNSLDETQYTPVINTIREKNNNLAIEGYFFGTRENTQVTLTQGKNTYSSKNKDFTINSIEGNDPEKIIITRPEGLTAGEVTVTVTDLKKPSQRQSFSRILYLTTYSKTDKNEKHIFTDIPLPSDYTWFTPTAIFTLKDRIILAGSDSRNYSDMTLSYNPKSKKWSKLKHPIDTGLLSGTTWNKRYIQIFLKNDILWLKTWDTSKGYTDSVKLTLDNDKFSNTDSVTLYNDGDHVFLIHTAISYDEYGTIIPKPTTIHELDPALTTIKPLTTLEESFKQPLVTHKEETVNNEIKKTLCICGVDLLKANSPEADKSLKTKCFEMTDQSLKTVSAPDLSPAKPLYYTDNEFALSGCALKDGIFLCGAYTADINEESGYTDILADSLIYRYENSMRFEPLSEKIMARQIYDTKVTAYKDNVYITGLSAVKVGLPFLSVISEKTLTDYGNKRFSTDEDIKVKKLKLDKKKLEIVSGETQKLEATVSYKDPAKTTPVIFDSSNTMVVRVNPLTGQLRAMDQGTAVITARCGKKKATCKIKVSYPGEPLTGLNKTSLTLKSGEMDYLSLGKWYLTGDEKLTWKSDNKKVADVKNGVVTAKKEGSAKITATWKKNKEVITYTCDVTVLDSASTVSAPSVNKPVTISDSIKFFDGLSGEDDNYTLHIKKGSIVALYFDDTPMELSDMAKAKWKAKGGAVKVKNGVIIAKNTSKDDKDGNTKPSTVIYSSGKNSIEIKVYVE